MLGLNCPLLLNIKGYYRKNPKNKMRGYLCPSDLKPIRLLGHPDVKSGRLLITFDELDVFAFFVFEFFLHGFV